MTLSLQGRREESPRILVAIPTEAHGGCEYNAVTFAADLARNYQCDVWVSFPLNEKLGFMADLAVENGLHFVSLEATFVKSDNADIIPAQEKALWDVVDTVSPDAVFIPLPWPKRGQGLISAASAIGLPALVKFALVPETWSANDFVNPETRSALKHNQIWFSNSAYSSRLLEEHFRLQPKTVDSFHVGPIGLNRLTSVTKQGATVDEPVSRFERLGLSEPEGSDEVFVIATVARLSVQKGYPHLLEAALELLPKYPHLRFVWVGDGELFDELNKKIMESGFADRFSLLGFRKDVREILRESDLFVLPTIYEGGCSQALLEAMEESVPVVVSDTSAVGEVIDHGRNGLLAECGNPADLKLKIEKAIGDAALRARLTENATETVRDFSAEVMFRKTRERLEQLMERKFQPRSEPMPLKRVRYPEVIVHSDDHEILVDLIASQFTSGVLAKPDHRGHRQILSEAKFHIYDPEIREASNVFLAGTRLAHSPAGELLEVSVNGIPLNLEVIESGQQWKAVGQISQELLQSPDLGICISIRCGAARLTTERNRPVLSIRKIAFRRRRGHSAHVL